MLFRTRLRVYKGAAPPCPGSREAGYRASILKLYFGKVSDLETANADRFMLVSSLLNGDWEKQASEIKFSTASQDRRFSLVTSRPTFPWAGQPPSSLNIQFTGKPRFTFEQQAEHIFGSSQDIVEHYCPEGCCVGVETVDVFCDVLVDALISGSCPLFARNRWTDSSPALSWAGLLASIHGILQSLVPPWVRVLSNVHSDFTESDFRIGEDDELGPRGLVARPVSEVAGQMVTYTEENPQSGDSGTVEAGRCSCSAVVSHLLTSHSDLLRGAFCSDLKWGRCISSRCRRPCSTNRGFVELPSRSASETQGATDLPKLCFFGVRSKF
jgi:hypothetical protein